MRGRITGVAVAGQPHLLHALGQPADGDVDDAELGERPAGRRHLGRAAVHHEKVRRIREPAWPALLSLPGAHLHLYGKATARRGRKMGHLTLTAASPHLAEAAAREAAARLGLALPGPGGG